MNDQHLDLDAIEAKTAELRQKIDRKNPWPSDNESFWMAEGWKNGTRNALDKLHTEALVAEVRRLRQQRRLLLASIARKDARTGEGDRVLREFLGAPDPICGDENAGDWCELEPGHQGHHRADTVEWVARPTAEESHVVADGSDDPEHVDDCPGCVPAASEEQQ